MDGRGSPPPWSVTTATGAQVALWGAAQPASAGAAADFSRTPPARPQVGRPRLGGQTSRGAPAAARLDITLAPRRPAAVLAHASGAADDLGRLVELLREQELTSALPLVTGRNRSCSWSARSRSRRRDQPVRAHHERLPLVRGPAEGPPGRSSRWEPGRRLPRPARLSAIVAIGYARRGTRSVRVPRRAAGRRAAHRWGSTSS